MRPLVVAHVLLAAALLAPAPAAARDGSVDVRSSPAGAELVIDGTPVGETPRSASLPPGKHTITLRLRGYLPLTQTVMVKPGQTDKLYLLLTRAGAQGLRVRDSLKATPAPGLGLVVVTTDPPGLRVHVNGERVEQTTPVAFDIGPGTYDVAIKLGEVELTTAPTVVKEGWRVEVKRTLRKEVAAARARGQDGAVAPRPDDPAPGPRRRGKCTCSSHKKLKACVEKKRACKLGTHGAENGGYALCYACRQFKRLPRKRRADAETACDTRSGRAEDCVCRDIRRVLADCLEPQDACLRRCGGE